MNRKAPGAQLHIRPAQTEDKAAIISVWHACELTRPWNDPGLDFDRAVGRPLSDVLIGTLDGGIIATAMVGLHGHRGWIYYLGVLTNFRRLGFGHQMVSEAESWLRERGAPKVQLMVRETNEAAMGFYERIGYENQQVAVLGKFFI